MKLVEHAYYSGGTQHRYILDEHLPVSPTSCGHDGRERRADDSVPEWQRGSRNTDHRAAYAPKAMQPKDSRAGLALLDCPCDVACPRCGAGVGRFCTTLDGGGSSGGGYVAKWHTVRIKASPACRAIASGAKTRCDLGDHDWASTETSRTAPTAYCQQCGLTAAYTPTAATRDDNTDEVSGEIDCTDDCPEDCMADHRGEE